MSVFVVLDITFLFILLPQITDAIAFFDRLALNWEYAGLSWFLGCALGGTVCAIIWLAAVLLRKFNFADFYHIINAKCFVLVFGISLIVSNYLILLGCGYFLIVHKQYHIPKGQENISTRIAFFSDVHLGFDDNEEKLARICDVIVREKCDTALFGGDLIDDIELLPRAALVLGALARKLPHGVYFVNGNGDCADGHWPLIREQLRKNGVTVIENAVYNIGSMRQPIWLAGVLYGDRNNSDNYDRQKQRVYLQATLQKLPTGYQQSPVLLLAHTPEIGEYLGNTADIDLALFGHTHGGQVKIASFRFLKRGYRYFSGEYQVGSMQILVSNGIGQWFPIRINVPQELHVLDISCGKDN